jgi:hypothetical protein
MFNNLLDESLLSDDYDSLNDQGSQRNSQRINENGARADSSSKIGTSRNLFGLRQQSNDFSKSNESQSKQ